MPQPGFQPTADATVEITVAFTYDELITSVRLRDTVLHLPQPQLGTPLYHELALRGNERAMELLRWYQAQSQFRCKLILMRNAGEHSVRCEVALPSLADYPLQHGADMYTYFQYHVDTHGTVRAVADRTGPASLEVGHFVFEMLKRQSHLIRAERFNLAFAPYNTPQDLSANADNLAAVLARLQNHHKRFARLQRAG